MKPVSFVLKEPLGQREQAAPAPAMPAPTVSVEPPVTAPSNRPGSWFARHWRGELTLAQSYWINMGLLSVPFGLLGAALGASGESAFADAPRVFSALTLALLAGCLIIAPWQIVGVWRAAKRHVTTGGRRFWARAAQVVSATNAIMLVGQLVAVAPSRGTWVTSPSVSTRWVPAPSASSAAATRFSSPARSGSAPRSGSRTCSSGIRR
jgi:hypothetical protein